MKKLFLFLVVVMMLAACSEGTSQEGSGNEGEKLDESTTDPSERNFAEEGLPEYNQSIADLEDQTLEVWMASDYANKPPIQDAIKEFEKTYPNISIKTTGVPWGDMKNKVKLAVSGGAPPDLAHFHAFAMGALDLAEPLDKEWEEWGKIDEFIDGGIQDVVWKGTNYGVPIDINTTIFLYNKKLFEENNVEPPKSLEEIQEIGKKLTKDDGSRYGFITNASGWSLYGHIVAEGAQLLKQEDGKTVPNLNGEKVVDVMKTYTEMATKHNISPIPPANPRQTDHPVAMFGTGRAASFVSGPWDIARIRDEFPQAYENLATAVMPGQAEGSVLGGGSLFVPKGSDSKKASFELMKWFVSKKYAMRMAEEMGRHPVKTKYYDHEMYQDPLLKPFAETLKNAKPYKLEAYPEANQAWYDALRNSFDGTDVKEALNNAQETAEEVVE